MKFTSVFGLLAGLTSLASAAPTKGSKSYGGDVVVIEAATIFVEESTQNYYITFEEIELVESM